MAPDVSLNRAGQFSERDEVMEKVLAGAVIILVMAVVTALPTMWLWDFLMPSLFKTSTITLVQAWVLNVLSGILFRGLGK